MNTQRKLIGFANIEFQVMFGKALYQSSIFLWEKKRIQVKMFPTELHSLELYVSIYRYNLHFTIKCT